MRSKISVTAAGDFMPQRRVPENYKGFEEVSNFIKRADARFFNLETTLPDNTCYGNQFYGGSCLRADKSILSDAERYGFNILAWATNHTMDYSHKGVECTLEALKNAGFPSAGVGKNLDEASSPAFIDTKNGSVGVIGVVSTMMNVAAMAGRQSRRVPGRPGVNGLRVDDYVEVTPEQFDIIQDVVNLSHMNAQADISRAEGYTPPLPDGVTAFRGTNVRRGEKTRYVTHPNKKDMDRISPSRLLARSATTWWSACTLTKSVVLTKSCPEISMLNSHISASTPEQAQCSGTVLTLFAPLKYTRAALYSTVWVTLYSKMSLPSLQLRISMKNMV